MPRKTYAAQQAQIEKEIDRLRKKAQALRHKRRKPALTFILNSMAEHDITPDEIVAAYKVKAQNTTATKKAKPVQVKRVVAAKYRHPETGKTWSGRGKMPIWLTAEKAKGASLESFLIR